LKKTDPPHADEDITEQRANLGIRLAQANS